MVLLFTDIVGSTELYDRLGDDHAEAIRRGHFRQLRHAITESGGREVKNLGDGLMVVFPSAIEAVRCGVRIQQEIAAAREGGPEARVGIHVGEPIRDEDDYFGTPVITAKRLCDRAGPGEILASELVVRLIGDRAAVDFEDVGELELKGLSAPLRAFRVNARPLDTSPLPPPIAGGSPLRFVGRADVLTSLRDAWKAAATGPRRVVLLGGEPGIGKTRLAAELASEVHRDGMTVLFGRCDEDALRSYQPFAEAFRHHLAGIGEARAREVLASEHAAVAELLPEVTGSRSSAPDTDRSALFAAVSGYLHALTEERPVLLLLDDLHWADEATLVMLRQLLRLSGDWRLMLVGTYRDTELGRTHPLGGLLAELRRDESVTRVRLGGLEDTDVGEVLGGAREESSDLASLLARETDGNPFFLREMVRHLVETGRLVDQEGALVPAGVIDRLDLPEGIKEVVGYRLSRLSGSANALLTTAAILGLEFDAAVAAELADLDIDTALAAIDEIVAARVAHEVGSTADRLAFDHALIRSTVLDELTSARRARLHWRAASALHDRGAPAPEVASHALEGADVGELDRALAWVIEAADFALERSAAYEETVELAERALQLLGDDQHAARFEIVIRQAEALARLGERDRSVAIALAAGEAAEERRDVGQMTRAGVVAARSWSPLEGPRIFALMERTLAALPHGDSAERARLTAVRALVEDDELMPRSERALELARRSGDDEAFCYAAIARSDALSTIAATEERLALLNEAMSRVDGMAEGRVGFIVCQGRAVSVHLELGDRDTAEAIAAESAAAIEALNLSWRSQSVLQEACFALLDSRLDDVLAIAGQVLDAVHPFDRLIAGALTIAATREQGLTKAVLPLADREAGDAPEWQATLGLLHAETGNIDGARQAFDGLIGRLDGTLYRQVGLALATEAGVLLGDDELVGEAASQLASWSGKCVTVSGYVCLGAVDRILGVAALQRGRLAEAQGLLQRALELNQRLRSPHLTAETRVNLAQLARSRGDSTEVTRLLDEVNRAAAQHGLVRIAGLAAQLAG